MLLSSSLFAEVGDRSLELLTLGDSCGYVIGDLAVRRCLQHFFLRTRAAHGRKKIFPVNAPALVKDRTVGYAT